MCANMKNIGLLQYTMDVFNRVMLGQVSDLIAAEGLELEEVLRIIKKSLFRWLRIFWGSLDQGKGAASISLRLRLTPS